MKSTSKKKLDLSEINSSLKVAIDKKDKHSILKIYEEIESADELFAGDMDTAETYELLLDQANDILYS